MKEFVACFSDVADPRQDNARHDLHEILLIALCTMLCGGEDCSDMEEFGRAKEPFLREFLRLKHGVPSHDTFSRVFRLLDPKPFQACFVRFMQRFAEGLEGVIAVDGKTMRGSLDRAAGKSPLHMVHAWAADRRLLLGQIATDEKSNEITAVPKLLEMLTLRGCIVTADAMSCQRAICGQIVAQGGDYVIALKGNQGTLHQDVALFLEDTERPAEPSHTTVDNDHGRIETRTGEVCTDIAWLQEQHAWPGLAAIGKMVRTRETREKATTETTYYILSTQLTAERFSEVARAHWGVENGLHWVLDVTMNEDRTRHRKDNGPENIALLRRLALNLAKLERSRGSMKGKLKRAGWNDAFLAKLLQQFGKCHMR
ncbi:transposase DDE domain protein [mine drainage metagenome]|uniref:Transposase DDE domain protein n=1 Tax=mine drainage metagenome TaxID=410659 RepID=A0A1J5Q327_9ZZZZ